MGSFLTKQVPSKLVGLKAWTSISFQICRRGGFGSKGCPKPTPWHPISGPVAQVGCATGTSTIATRTLHIICCDYLSNTGRCGPIAMDKNHGQLNSSQVSALISQVLGSNLLSLWPLPFAFVNNHDLPAAGQRCRRGWHNVFFQHQVCCLHCMVKQEFVEMLLVQRCGHAMFAVSTCLRTNLDFLQTW